MTQIPYMRFVLFNTCMGKSPPHTEYTNPAIRSDSISVAAKHDNEQA